MMSKPSHNACLKARCKINIAHYSDCIIKDLTKKASMARYDFDSPSAYKGHTFYTGGYHGLP